MLESIIIPGLCNNNQKNVKDIGGMQLLNREKKKEPACDR